MSDHVKPGYEVSHCNSPAGACQPVYRKKKEQWQWVNMLWIQFFAVGRELLCSQSFKTAVILISLDSRGTDKESSSA